MFDATHKKLRRKTPEDSLCEERTQMMGEVKDFKDPQRETPKEEVEEEREE